MSGRRREGTPRRPPLSLKIRSNLNKVRSRRPEKIYNRTQKLPADARHVYVPTLVRTYIRTSRLTMQARVNSIQNRQTQDLYLQHRRYNVLYAAYALIHLILPHGLTITPLEDLGFTFCIP
jgi:hypothetical protein